MGRHGYRVGYGTFYSKGVCKHMGSVNVQYTGETYFYYCVNASPASHYGDKSFQEYTICHPKTKSCSLQGGFISAV